MHNYYHLLTTNNFCCHKAASAEYKKIRHLADFYVNANDLLKKLILEDKQIDHSYRNIGIGEVEDSAEEVVS